MTSAVDRSGPGVRITVLANERAPSGERLDLDGRIISFTFEDTEKKTEDGKVVQDHYIVGPDGSGVKYYQVTSSVGPDQRPSWATCQGLAYTTEGGVYLKDLAGIPGICERTLAEVLDEREKKISELEANSAEAAKACSLIEEELATLKNPPEEEPAE